MRPGSRLSPVISRHSSIIVALTIALTGLLSASAHAQLGGSKAGPPPADEGGIAGATAPTGACCFGPSGMCAQVTHAECDALLGFYLGDDSPCSNCNNMGRCCIYNPGQAPSCQETRLWECAQNPNWGYWQPGGTCATPCEPQGACCVPGQFCYQTAQFLCEAFPDRIWLGEGVSCDECPNVGACCTAEGCIITIEANCIGTFMGPGTTCDDCTVTTGACCTIDGCVTVADEAECDGLKGSFQGIGSNCTACIGTTGMCCIDTDPADGFSCIETDHLDCVDNRGGVYYGDGTWCGDYDCEFDAPEAGACCLPDGSCSYTVEWLCLDAGGTFSGVGVLCADADCGNNGSPGACCYDNGDSCQILTQAECLAIGGTYGGANSECDFDTCPGMLGKCCIQNPDGTSSCLTTTIDDCFGNQGAVWFATPGVCEDPGAPHCPLFGACCMPNGSCGVWDAGLCAFFGGVYKGDGTTCADADNNGVSEHCEVIGDVDGDGDVNIDDLLEVINHWGPCPSPCPSDVEPPPAGDGQVNINDLLTVINNWG